MKTKGKCYVVWKGRTPGIFHSWEECKKQIHAFQGAIYKSFPTLEEAKASFHQSENKVFLSKPLAKSISVDGACDVKSGLAEYKGVYTEDKKELFRAGPFEQGTNNIVEFLAIVHALAYVKEKELSLPIYSDSRTAISWVEKKKVNTLKKPNEKNKILFSLIERALKWLHENPADYKLLKWQTDIWGENPADFGRK